jgi:hypothetical protein
MISRYRFTASEKRRTIFSSGASLRLANGFERKGLEYSGGDEGLETGRGDSLVAGSGMRCN